LVVVLAIGIYVAVPALIILVCARLVRDRFAFARRLAGIALPVVLVSASTFVSLVPGGERRVPANLRRLPLEHRVRGARPRAAAPAARAAYYWSDGSEFTLNFGELTGPARPRRPNYLTRPGVY
jgi:hypothetical protein